MLVRTDRGTVSEGSFLHVGLAGMLQEAPMSGGLILDPDDKPILVTEYAAGIRAAAEDDRITGLFLTLDGPGASIAGYQEIRDAVEAFDASGKPCVAYAEGLSMGSYYLASACDTVLLAPSGALMVSGMSMSTTYYKGTLDMLEAEAEFVHVGDFKSAVEPFMRTEPSEPAAEAMEYLLGGIYDRLVADIAEGRGLSEAAVRDAIDHPSLTPKGAIARDLIDGPPSPTPSSRRSRTPAARAGWTGSPRPASRETPRSSTRRSSPPPRSTSRAGGRIRPPPTRRSSSSTPPARSSAAMAAVGCSATAACSPTVPSAAGCARPATATTWPPWCSASTALVAADSPPT